MNVPQKNQLDLFKKVSGGMSFAGAEHEYYSSIIETRAFRRLHNISFLGALDYALHAKESLAQRSRAVHSIGVAQLVKYVSEQRGYCRDLERHLVTAALLHDIGHSPLSHSVEPFISRTFGFDHHDAADELLSGRAPNSGSLYKLLLKHVDVAFVSNLISQKASGEGADLFNNPINVDTVDGITRANSYLGGWANTLTRRSIVDSAFLRSKDVQDEAVLDEFWTLKHRVYNHLIHSSVGLVADKLSELFFDSQDVDIEEEDVYLSEVAWKRKFKPLFDTLDAFKKSGEIPPWLSGEKAKYKSRKYYINRFSIESDRYVCTKSLQEYRFPEGSRKGQQLPLY